MPKRHHSETIYVEDIIKTIDLNKGFRAGLDELTTDELTALLADLANSANIPTSALQKPTPNLPSFSTAKWSEVARGFGMQSVASRATLEHFQTPKYYLLLSLHEAMFKDAWRWHDVYRERPEQTREAARVRLLEPYIVPIISLFQGRLVDAPEETMMATKYSSGGRVEHEIYMIGGFMFLVVEFKLDMLKDHSLVQLFLELLSAAEMNKELSFKNLRVYSLLTDFLQFRFYSYDPCEAKFCMDEIIMIGSERVQALSRMIKVSNKLFSILLSAYEDGLQAIIAQSKDRAKKNDVILSTVYQIGRY
ncbi:hypothetical protein BS47DRAFT_1288727 [Hydnum rufescens UP504]|uniref:Uncharacterized protein n=1 Tax=Hydnum rufescens UP504 TaxID=1448309 RepID=A0A9P6B7R7_9AGAM|nr:hypothetical protein BS47DRAFT_1288727 [Hydnum rufescens UP504]